MITRQEKAYMQQIGQKIKEKRQEKGITQKQLYVRFGIPGNTCSNWETGKVSPTALNLYRIANALGCDPKDLLP